MHWIISTGKKYNIDYVIFMGDLWEQRFSLSVKTMNVAIKCVEELAVSFEKVFLIVGNHDTYYKNTNEINSIDFLKMISRNENIEIINNEPYFIMLNGKTLGLFPWGSNIKEIYSDSNFEKCDYAFGHFALNGIEMTGGLSIGEKYDIKDIFKISNKVFSGHYHKNKLYKSISDDSGLLMVGSPMQLNWGEYGQDKFIYVLDPNKDKLNEIKNTINSRYEKVYYSKVINKKYSDDELRLLCKDNYVKLVVDVKYQFNQILSIIENIRTFNPITVEIEYLISITDDAITKSADSIVKSGSKDNKEYLMEYLETVYNEISKVDEDVDKTLLFEMANSFYEKSQMTEKEQE